MGSDLGTDLIGQTSAYTITGRLERGMGVYRAHDSRLGRDVATGLPRSWPTMRTA